MTDPKAKIPMVRSGSGTNSAENQSESPLDGARGTTPPEKKSGKLRAKVKDRLKDIGKSFQGTFHRSRTPSPEKGELEHKPPTSEGNTSLETPPKADADQEPIAFALSKALKDKTLKEDQLLAIKDGLDEIIYGAANVPDDASVRSHDSTRSVTGSRSGNSNRSGSTKNSGDKQSGDGPVGTATKEITGAGLEKNPMLFVEAAINAKNRLSVRAEIASAPGRKILQLSHGTLLHKTAVEIQGDLNYPKYNESSDSPFHQNSEKALPSYLNDVPQVTSAASSLSSSAPPEERPEPYVEYMTTSKVLGGGIRYVVDIMSNKVYLSAHYGTKYRQLMAEEKRKNESKASSSGLPHATVKEVKDKYASYSPFVELTDGWDTRGMVIDAKKQWAKAFIKQHKDAPGYDYLSENQYAAYRGQKLIDTCIDEPEKITSIRTDVLRNPSHALNEISEQLQHLLRTAMKETA